MLVALVLALLASAALPFVSTSVADEAVVVDVPIVLPRVSGAFTVPVPLGARAVMVGASWVGEADAPTVLALRARRLGAWGPWQHLRAGDDGPDLASPEGRAGPAGRAISDPLFVGGADLVELRVSAGTVRALRVHIVRERTVRRLTMLEASAAPREPNPGIIGRPSWGARRPKRVEYASSLARAVVHHTVNSNSYSRADVPAMLRGMQAYHMDVRGWNDIGYNFLVDRFGRMWEGRGGGITRPVIGGHTQGFNTSSTGIALIGEFTHAPPTPEARSSLATLLGWRLAMGGVDPLGKATVVSRGNDRYPAGTRVTFPAVTGHRDNKSTACPGQQLYDAVPAIRRVAAARYPNIIGRFETSEQYLNGIRVVGWVIDRTSNAPVEVEARVGGDLVAVLTADEVRRDVERRHPGAGSRHGFDAVLPGAVGVQEVCLVARNIGSGPNRRLGCRMVELTVAGIATSAAP